MLVKALDLSGPQFLHPYHSENVPYSNTGPFFFFLNTCEVKKKFFFLLAARNLRCCTDFPLVAASRGYPVGVMHGLPLRLLLLLPSTGSRACGLRSCGGRAQ